MGSRAENEKEIYNRGFDEKRKKYDEKFGHANGIGYYWDYQNEIISSVFKNAKDKRVLELGSSTWRRLLDMDNYRPKEVVCINISERELKIGIDIYNANSEKYHNVKLDFLVMDAHHLDFEDESFDVVIGGGILHHLDLEIAIKEVARVLKKDGFCFFTEPLDGNPVGKMVRRLTPGARTKDEKPLDKKDFDIINRYLDAQYRFIQLSYVLAGVVSAKLFKSPYNMLMKTAFKLDRFLERRMTTSFKLMYRCVIINARKQ